MSDATIHRNPACGPLRSIPGLMRGAGIESRIAVGVLPKPPKGAFTKLDREGVVAGASNRAARSSQVRGGANGTGEG